jgi:hypothetical protein
MRLRGEVLQESDICAWRGKRGEAYTCLTGPLQEACSAVVPFRSFLTPLIVPFHGVCARFLISSEENRYGYDYRSRCFDAAPGD